MTEFETELPKEFFSLLGNTLFISNDSSEPLYELSKNPEIELSSLKVPNTDFYKTRKIIENKVYFARKPFLPLSLWEYWAWKQTPAWNHSSSILPKENPSYMPLSGKKDLYQKVHLPEDYWAEDYFYFAGKVYPLKYKVHTIWSPDYGRCTEG